MEDRSHCRPGESPLQTPHISHFSLKAGDGTLLTDLVHLQQGAKYGSFSAEGAAAVFRFLFLLQRLICLI